MIQEKTIYNGHTKCQTSETMTKDQAAGYANIHLVYLRCLRPCGNRWWYFDSRGKEITSDEFYNN